MVISVSTALYTWKAYSGTEYALCIPISNTDWRSFFLVNTLYVLQLYTFSPTIPLRRKNRDVSFLINSHNMFLPEVAVRGFLIIRYLAFYLTKLSILKSVKLFRRQSISITLYTNLNLRSQFQSLSLNMCVGRARGCLWWVLSSV